MWGLVDEKLLTILKTRSGLTIDGLLYLLANSKLTLWNCCLSYYLSHVISNPPIGGAIIWGHNVFWKPDLNLRLMICSKLPRVSQAVCILSAVLTFCEIESQIERSKVEIGFDSRVPNCHWWSVCNFLHSTSCFHVLAAFLWSSCLCFGSNLGSFWLHILAKSIL